MTRVLAAAFAALLSLSGTARAQFYDEVGIALSGITNSAVGVKTTPGPLLWYSCNNPNAAPVYLQFFDTSASIVLGTTTPTLQWTVPPGQSTGPTPAQRSTGGAYYAVDSMQVAATTTSGGSVAPSSSLACTFGIR